MTDARADFPEEHFRLLVENSNDILTIRDADGRIRYANPSYQRVLGYKPEQMIGTTGFELLHPEDSAMVQSALSGFWKNPGARGSIQYRAQHANGSWVSLEVVAYNLLEDPLVRGVVINGREILGRKETGARPANKLSGILTTCASCKRIRSDGGTWLQFELYFRERLPVEFSHGLCPACVALWSPEQAEE